jgi:hypothetical protein
MRTVSQLVTSLLMTRDDVFVSFAPVRSSVDALCVFVVVKVIYIHLIMPTLPQIYV